MLLRGRLMPPYRTTWKRYMYHCPPAAKPLADLSSVSTHGFTITLVEMLHRKGLESQKQKHVAIPYPQGHGLRSPCVAISMQSGYRMNKGHSRIMVKKILENIVLHWKRYLMPSVMQKRRNVRKSWLNGTPKTYQMMFSKSKQNLLPRHFS